MILAYLGNFDTDATSESIWARAFTRLGHHVLRIRHTLAAAEGEAVYLELIEAKPDAVFYSRTHNDTALKAPWTERWRALEDLGAQTCALHLDVFFGLEEERVGWVTGIPPDPMFTMGLVCTPDGGRDAEWKAAGVNHRWLPPAIDRDVAYRGEPDPYYLTDVVFVGSAGYHPAYPERPKLIEQAQARWRNDYDEAHFIHVGPDGAPGGARRGHDLNPVIASSKVVVGDSCFALNPDLRISRYWSDRVPETLGRGGLLVHPYVEGLTEVHPHVVMPLPTEPSIDALLDKVDDVLSTSAQVREMRRREGYEHTLAGHTYDRRAQQVLDWLEETR